jgi:hypothetical protein
MLRSPELDVAAAVPVESVDWKGGESNWENEQEWQVWRYVTFTLAKMSSMLLLDWWLLAGSKTSRIGT